MNKSRLTYLFNSYYDKTASIKEKAEFLHMVSRPEYDEHLRLLLTQAWQETKATHQIITDEQADHMLSSILQNSPAKQPSLSVVKRSSRYKISRISTAAAAVVLLASGSYFWFKTRPSDLKTTQASVKVKDTGNRNKAVLTLFDGSKITLDNTRRGALLKQGHTTVIQQNTSTLAYNPGQNVNQSVIYNTLSTPKGGQYQLILPDGTKVWLNSASSIRFPTQFEGKERNVSLRGEAYFEVAKNANKPFKIAVNKTEIQVLGTHFNVMAYEDETSVNTTLLEGSVKVYAGACSKTLLPGQESRVSKNGQIKIVEADTEDVIAWKNGWFSLNQDDIQKVMRQISRRYNIDVVYEGKIPAGHFSGAVKQDNDISKVLNILQAGGIHFKNTGKKIIVLP